MRALLSLLLLASAALAQSLTVTPLRETATFSLNEPAGWTISGSPARVSYKLRRNNLDTLKEGTLDLSAGPARLDITLQEPAMLCLELRPEGSDEKKPLRYGAAVAPHLLKPPAPAPADFEAFWFNKLKALAEVPINPVLTPVATKVEGVELYTFQLDSLNSHVRGYLAKPAREGKFPAIMLYQWAGVYALNPETAARRAAEGWLAINVSSHDLPVTESKGIPSEYAAIGDTSRETSYFLNMYLRDARAVDYVLTRPDWDGITLVALGTSMGGHQSLVSAALRPQISAVLVNEPSGTNLNGSLYGYQVGYPTFPQTNPQTLETATYFDVVNFTPRIKSPVLAAVGYIDSICPPAGIFMAINRTGGTHEIIPMILSDHNNLTPQHQQAWESRHREVLDLLLHREPFVPRP